MADDDRGRSRVGSLESFFAKPVPLTAVSTGAIRFRATSQWTSSNWMTMGCAFHSIPVTCIACFFLIGKRKGAGRNVMDLNIEFATEKAREDFIELFFSPMVEDGMLEDEEFTPLQAAYFALGVGGNVDLSKQAQQEHEESERTISKAMREKIDEMLGPASKHVLSQRDRRATAANLADAWRRITLPPGIELITKSELEELRKWIEERFNDWEQHGALKIMRDFAKAEKLSDKCGINTSPGSRTALRNWFSNQARYLRELSHHDDQAIIGDESDVIVSAGDFPAGIRSPETEKRVAREEEIPAASDADVELAESRQAKDEKPRTDGDGYAVGAEGIAVLPAAPPVELPPPPTVLAVNVTDNLLELHGDNIRSYVRKRRQQLRDQMKTIVTEIDSLFGDFWG